MTSDQLTQEASDKYDYLGNVAVDTYQYHRPAVVNGDTEYYGFFDGHALDPFDFTYGWDSTGPDHRYIYVAEEWGPDFPYGYSGSQPYSGHRVRRWRAYQAEDHTLLHKMVV